MFKKILLLLIISCALLGSIGLMAQDQDPKKKEIYFGMGPSAYKGDLNGGFDKWSSSMYLGVKFNRFNKINGNFTLTIGTVNGQNVNYVFDNGGLPTPAPNRFFKTKFVGLNYELHYNFIDKENLKVYASQGIGIMRFDPKDEFNTSLIDQLETRAPSETYGNITLMLPTQVGVLYSLPNELSVGLQLGFSNTLSDYIDNISTYSAQGGKDNIFSYRFELHIPVSL
ncbi:MAG: hypothetical protein JXQ96_00410 [Cyclobacteriaceae bacterium]